MGVGRRFKRSNKHRTRRASSSQKSSGNIGLQYRRISRRLDSDSTTRFPFEGSSTLGRLCYAYWLGATGTARVGRITLAADTTVATPTYLTGTPTNAPVPATIAAYYAFCLADVPVFDGELGWDTFGWYRIRKIRLTLLDGRSLNTNGASTSYGGPVADAAEVMLVNTSKTGQFVGPFSLNDVTSAAVPTDDPWLLAENYPNRRNILKRSYLGALTKKSLSMVVDPTEDYVTNDSSNRITSLSTQTEDGLSGWYPQRAWPGNTDDGTKPAINVRRRRFRWTKLWVRSQVGNDIVSYLRDDKLAHGLQVMVRRSTYSTANLPYLRVHCTMSVEFRGHAMGNTNAYVAVLTTGPRLFPFTNSMMNNM